MPRILAVANRKGGVGKTTTTVNVATAMAAAGKKVLLIDFDPQGNASTSMGINKKGTMASSYDVLLGNSRLTKAIVWTEVPNFSIVPSSPDLAAAEIELVDVEKREFALKRALEKEAVKLMETRAIIGGIIAERSGHTLEEVYEKTKEDCYLDAEEAIDFGIATGIIEKW